MKTRDVSFYIGIVIILSASLLISCTTASMPQQRFIQTANLAGIKKIAVTVNIARPEVMYSQEQGVNGVYIVLFGLVGLAAEMMKPDIVVNETKAVTTDIDFDFHEEKMGDTFVRLLKETNRFAAVDYIYNNEMDDAQIALKNYDAVIRLFVDKITLNKISKDDVKIVLNVSVKMNNLNTSKTIWERSDSLTTSDKHAMEHYEKNGLKEMTASLEIAGKKLADDFIYLY